MAVGRDTMRCGIVYLWLVLGIVQSRSGMWWVMLSGRFSVGSLVVGAVDSGFGMGWEAFGHGFCHFGGSGFTLEVSFVDVALWYFFFQ